MFSKLLVFALAATAVNGQSSCLEDGQPDDDCCALPGHMSCSGGNHMQQSDITCWEGDYQGQHYIAYYYGCYPTTAPAGHDPTKCIEDGEADADCCALQGHESCATGYTVQSTDSACFQNPQITAYSYFCTSNSGSGSDDNAACMTSKCTSPGPNNDRDCWAGNGEPFSCDGGYSARMTGNTAEYQGQTWEEYTCCPGDLTDCHTDSCTSPNGQGGSDCWAGNGEPYTCQEGQIPQMTGQTAPYAGATYYQYECCSPPTPCSAAQCTSSNGADGHDCWAGNGDPFSCAAGYSARMTGNSGPYAGSTWYEYTCCAVGGSEPSTDDSQCVASACREYTTDSVDDDCCGVIGQTFCGDGFAMSYKTNDQNCEQWSSQHRGTCCIPNGEHHDQTPQNDPSKCQSNGVHDPNCCAFDGGSACSDGFKLTSSHSVCFTYQQYTAYTYTCTPQDSMSGQPSDPSKCLENGSFDNDCCALQGTNSCADDYDMEQTNHVCYQGSGFTAYSYHCLEPADVVVVHG